MKKLNITLLSIFATSAIYAGGTFVEPTYETKDIEFAEESVIDEPVEEYSEQPITEEYVEQPVEEYIKPVKEHLKPIKEEVVTKNHTTLPPPLPIKDIKTNGFYAGIGISSAKFETCCKCKGTSRSLHSGTDKTLGLMGRVGYDVNQYVGVEARGIRTNWKSDGGKIKHIGVFVKPMLPVGEETNLYALAGLAKTTTQGRLQHVNSKSFAWGVGVEHDISEDRAKDGRYNRKFDGEGDQEQGLGIFADYERLIQKSGSPNLDTINVGVTYDF